MQLLRGAMLSYLISAIKIRQMLLGDRNPVVAIAILSLLFEVAWFSVQNIGFHCDSPAYVLLAQSLYGHSIAPLITWVRTIGYPLLIVLSGVVGPHGAFHSFLGILIIQAAMAVAMPVLIFKILEPYNRRIALLTALVLIISLQPYIASKLIMTEQSFKFFSLLLVFFAVKIHQSNSPRGWVKALLATSLFLTLLRPASLLMVVIVFAALLVSRWQYWKSLAAGFLAFGMGMFIYSFIVSLSLPPVGLYTAGAVTYKPNSISSLLDLAFYDLYMHDNGARLRPEKGPRRSELRKIVEAFARDLKTGWTGRHPARYFALYANDPKSWVDSLYTDPNRYKYVALKDAVLTYSDQGPNLKFRQKAKRAIGRAVLEAYLDEPWRAIKMIFRYGFAMPGGGSTQIIYNKLFSEYQLARFSPKNGPASREFIRIVRQFLIDNPESVRTIAPPETYIDQRKNAHRKKDYINDPDGFIREQLIGIPNPQFLYSIWSRILFLRNPKETRALYGAVVWEGIVNGSPHGPWGVYKGWFDNATVQLRRFFFNPYGSFTFFYKLVYCWQNTTSTVYEQELLNGMRLFSHPKIQPHKPVIETGTNWFAPGGPWWGNATNWFDLLVQGLWMFVHIASNLFIIVGAPFALWRSPYRWPFLVITALIFSQALPSVVFSFAQDRYVDMILPMTILLAGYAGAAMFGGWRNQASPPKRNLAKP